MNAAADFSIQLKSKRATQLLSVAIAEAIVINKIRQNPPITNNGVAFYDLYSWLTPFHSVVFRNSFTSLQALDTVLVLVSLHL